MKKQPPRPKSTVRGVRCTRWEPNGNGEYVAYWGYTDPNTGKWISTGPGDEHKALAEAGRQKADTTKYENKEIRSGLQAKRSKFKTVSELLDWWLKTEKRRIQEKQKGVKRGGKAITQKTYQRNKDRVVHLKRHLGAKYPALTAEHIDSYWDARDDERENGARAHTNTINYEVIALAAAYTKAVKRKKIPDEFMPAEFTERSEERFRRPITDAEHEALLAQCDKVDDIDFKDVLITAYETGMRISDIQAVKKGQVVLDEIRIARGQQVDSDYFSLGFDTKTEVPRYVPISPALRPIIERRLADHPDEQYLFTRIVRGKGRKRWSENSISKRCEYRAKQAGLLLYGDNLLNEDGERIGFTFHCYKSRMADYLMDRGVDYLVARSILGTMSREAMRHYLRGTNPGLIVSVFNEAGQDIKRDKNHIIEEAKSPESADSRALKQVK